MNKLVLIVGLACCLLNSGCIAERVMAHNERQNLATLNFEREKAGMRPLTMDEYKNGPH